MAKKTNRTTRSRSRSTTLSVPAALLILLVLGAIYLFDTWQEGRAELPNTPLPPVTERSTGLPDITRRATQTPGAAASSGSLAVYFTNPLANANSGGEETYLVEAIDRAQRTIDLAIYNLSLEDVGDALLRARDRGVQVRLVMESDAMKGQLAQRLIDSGLPITGDEREALMHNKFMIIDNQEVWMGSMNFTGASVYRDFNNLVRLRSQRAAQNYAVEFNEMFVERLFGPKSRANTPYPRVTIDGIPIEIYFSPEDDVADKIIAQIQEAETSIDFLAYSFTSDPIAEAMRERAAAGVKIRGVFDESQVRSNQGGEFSVFKDAGFDVRQDGIPGLMHNKVIVIDGKVVVTGSYNFSAAAERSNDENVVIIHDAGIAQQYLEHVDVVYENSVP